MKIAIDWDGVIVNFTKLWCIAVKEMYNIDVQPIDITDWDIAEQTGIDWDRGVKVFTHIRKNDFYNKYGCPVDSNFHIAIRKLQEEHECYILTKNPKHMLPKFEQYLKAYGIDLPIHRVDTMEGKVEHDFDFLIDDCPLFIGMPGLEGRLIVYDTPYNYKYDGAEIRVHNWKEVVDVIEEAQRNQG